MSGGIEAPGFHFTSIPAAYGGVRRLASNNFVELTQTSLQPFRRLAREKRGL
jgi:hypothetical protein